MVRRHYPSLTTLLACFPTTTLLVNCSALGSLALSDVKDTNLYSTRGQTVLIAEPKVRFAGLAAIVQFLQIHTRLPPIIKCPY
jgi:hypothetical protein